MSRVRNHVNVLTSSGIAKGTEEIEEKAKAEIAMSTPELAEATNKILKNILDAVEIKTKK